MNKVNERSQVLVKHMQSGENKLLIKTQKLNSYG
jgi:hypothetical protein